MLGKRNEMPLADRLALCTPRLLSTVLSCPGRFEKSEKTRFERGSTSRHIWTALDQVTQPTTTKLRWTECNENGCWRGYAGARLTEGGRGGLKQCPYDEVSDLRYNWVAQRPDFKSTQTGKNGFKHQILSIFMAFKGFHAKKRITQSQFAQFSFRYGIFWMLPGESSCPDGSEYVWQRGVESF